MDKYGGRMPLIAILDGDRVDATTHDRQSWAALKKSDDRKRLVMPVCNIRAVAKSRGDDTRLFAHYRLRDCSVDHGGESPQHLAMKEALAWKIGTVPGWHALIEFPHPSREWIIDVLAESDDKHHRVAFEMQLSSQTLENYRRRSQLPVDLPENGLQCTCARNRTTRQFDSSDDARCGPSNSRFHQGRFPPWSGSLREQDRSRRESRARSQTTGAGSAKCGASAGRFQVWFMVSRRNRRLQSPLRWLEGPDLAPSCRVGGGSRPGPSRR